MNFGYHNWRARTKNSSDTYGDWSALEDSTYIDGQFSTLTLLHPINRATVTELLLQWEPVLGAVGYELDVDGSQVLINDGSQASYTPSLGYGVHSWRARSKAGAGDSDHGPVSNLSPTSKTP